jgi:hypothetical protein
MTTPDILCKLSHELDAGIATEAQVVYLLAGIRKLIERDDARGKYRDLNFHCDWALHSKLDRRAAQEVLREFDAAHPLLKDKKMELDELPDRLRSEIDRISKMRSFKEELFQFLEDYRLPPLKKWTHFLHLYAKVIEDIPLVVTDASAQHISQVTVQVQLTPEPLKGHRLFQVTWRIHGKDGGSGSIFVINSYSEPKN